MGQRLRFNKNTFNFLLKSPFSRYLFFLWGLSLLLLQWYVSIVSLYCWCFFCFICIQKLDEVHYDLLTLGSLLSHCQMEFMISFGFLSFSQIAPLLYFVSFCLILIFFLVHLKRTFWKKITLLYWWKDIYRKLSLSKWYI